MTTKNTKKPINKKNAALGVGIGVATAAVAAAGYYFFGAKNAKVHREKVTDWAHQMKDDVVKKAKELEKLDEKSVKKIIEEVSQAYGNIKSIKKGDLIQATQELGHHWQELKKEITMTPRKIKKL